MLPILAALSGVAFAGSGPWTVGEGQMSTFVGIESQRLTKLHVAGDDGTTDVLDVGEGLNSFGLKAIATLGFTSRFEAEIELPWYRIQANRIESQVCQDLGLNACATTTTIGVIGARGKALVIDELAGSPVSVAIGGELRFGQFTAPTRQRITNAGEGTFDVGAFGSIGRTGGLGNGYYSTNLDFGGRYRFPNTDSYPGLAGDERVPGPELLATGSAILSPYPAVGFGPLVTGFWRPTGRNFLQLDLSDPDRFSALKAANLRGGLEFILRSGRISAVFGALTTLAARNNPTNATLFHCGLSWRGQVKATAD